MKKYFLLSAFSSITVFSLAQEPADALRFGWTVPGATARIQAVGGAMGSLGGDITATFVNPAGLAFYRTADFVFSPSFFSGNTKATYLERDERKQQSKFTWGTTGFVFGGGNRSTTDALRGGALSIAYNRSADFNSNFLYRGLNTQSSYSQKFLEEIRINNIKDGNVVANNFPFGTSLAFNSYLVDTIGGSTNGNFEFQSRAANILNSAGLLQESAIETRGGIDEFALGLALNFHDKWMIGGTIGVPVLHFRRDSRFSEADPTTNINNFDYFDFEDKLTTTGVGINLKAGAIFKPAEYWRLGMAIHSPSFYSLKDRYEASLFAELENGGTVPPARSTDLTNGAPAEFKYALSTPYKVIGSISYVLREVEDVRKQRGFLTADVEYVNYKSASFSPDEEEGTMEDEQYLEQLNDAIDKAYKGAFNFRAGGELKFTVVMVRLGAAWYGNPYKDINGEKGHRLNLSGGLGYRHKGFFVDVTYVHAYTRDAHFGYRLQYAPYSGAAIRRTAGNVFATAGFKF